MIEPFHRSKDGMYELYQGDCVEIMDALPRGSVQCCVSSPPYWSLRDYGLAPAMWPEITYAPMPGMPPITIPAMEANLGLEATPEAFVGHIVHVYRSVWRVLRDDGVCFVNLGDSYFGDSPTRTRSSEAFSETWDLAQTASRGGLRRSAARLNGLKPKDLCMIPARVALALQADGWWLRSDIVWAKRNCLPESVRDRCTKSHEYIFMLCKSKSYFYDLEAIREPMLVESVERFNYAFKGDPYRNSNGVEAHHGKGFMRSSTASPANPSGRNKRTVWHIATEACSAAHFATFPQALVEPCIKAGTSERGCCPECGAPYTRIVEKSRTFESGSGRSGNTPVGKNGEGMQGGGETKDVRRGPCVSAKTTGWRPSCKCDAGEPVPCVVLDPFVGSGTSVGVAVRLGRRGIGIDLSETYLRDIAVGRIERLRQPVKRKKARVKKQSTPQLSLLDQSQ